MRHVDAEDIFIPILDTDALGLKALPFYKGGNIERPPPPLQGTKTSLSWIPLNISLLKLFFLFCGITLAICALYLQKTGIIDIGNIKHLMTGPVRIVNFVSLESQCFPTRSRETLRFEGNKIHRSPRDQSLSDLLYSTANGSKGGKQTITLLTNDLQQWSTFCG